MFLALVSAFVVRRNMSDANDWVSVHKPTAMIFNTVVLVLSSLVLDFSRRALKSGHRTRFEIFWTAATALGLVFLGGQIYVWYLLKQAGIFVAGNPASSFLYLFTFIHALHVVGGVSALIWVDVQALRMRLGPSKRTAIDVWAIFWHFLDGLWLCLMVLFYVWG
jgi:cytochrome c oxidase subunit 3